MTPLMTWLVPTAGRCGTTSLPPSTGSLPSTMPLGLQPHVTLAATFDSPEDAAAQTLKAVTAAMSPVDVTFTAIGHDQTYFRSLYLLPEPSAQLTALPGPGRGPGAGRDN